jgi:predicted RNA-binding Zn-ribbon protein involved in translation (DUF1610 family)
MIVECQECLAEFEISNEPLEGEVFTCPICGEEHILEKGRLISLEFEGEDWGE